MKRLGVMLILSLLIFPLVLSQNIPKDNSASEQLIAQEHKNTRKFVSDELTRQRNEFYKGFEDRAEWYKREADDMINNAVWKLGLMWSGVVLLFFGISNFLNRRLEKRKWNKMLETARSEIKTDVIAELQQEKTKIDTEHKQTEQTLIDEQIKLNERKRQIDTKADALAKARPQLQAIQARIKQQQAELNTVMGKLDLFKEG